MIALLFQAFIIFLLVCLIDNGYNKFSQKESKYCYNKDCEDDHCRC